MDKEFATLSGGGNGNAPVGAIDGLFTINENGDQVYFSKGNLQYQASTNTWRFAENQWNYVGTQTPDQYGSVGGNVDGSDNQFISQSYCGWIDLFGWGTSGHNHGAVCYQPWNTSPSNSDYYAYGQFNYNLNDQTGMADWGYNVISNGGNETTTWRTLTGVEWKFVFHIRSASIVNNIPNARYAKARVANVQGLILFPDNYIHPSSVAQTIGINEGAIGWDGNNYSISDFELMEQNGVVFLPSAGARSVNGDILHSNIQGSYWSASYDTLNYTYAISSSFNEGIVGGYVYAGYRGSGYSVRLVSVPNHKNQAK